MDGAGTLCVAGGSVLCAGMDGAVWRMDRRTLMPQAFFPGGPGICDMLVSPDRRRVYTLSGEADSILMSDASLGSPLAVNRCGCNPQHMILADGMLGAAGAQSCRIHLYDPDTLEGMGEVSMPGPVYSAAFCAGCVFALCLTAELGSLLVKTHGGRQRTALLQGMPGYLLAESGMLLAATQGWLHVFAADDLQMVLRIKAPGRPSRMWISGKNLFAYDPLNACAWLCREGGVWHALHTQIRAMSVQ